VELIEFMRDAGYQDAVEVREKYEADMLAFVR
jgi:hypothetical protein